VRVTLGLLILLIFLLVMLGLASLDAAFQTRRAYRLNRENIRLKALLLIRGDREDDEDDDSPAEGITRWMAGLIDVTGPVAEAAAGARRQREEEGWSPTAAEAMAMPIYMIGMAKVTGAALSVTIGEGGDGDGG
jgi:hypothetical protein